MNTKRQNILLIFLLLSSSIYAKDYIKVKEASVVNRVKVRILKGEIFPKAENNKFLFGKDTVDFSGDKIEIITGIDEDLTTTKHNYVKNLDNINYQIDVTKLLNNKDTIKLIKIDNSIISFFDKGIDTIPINSCGDVFRIVIPNRPSLIFYYNEIPKAVVSEVISGKKEKSEDVPQIVNNLLVQLGLGVIILLLLGFTFWIIKKYLSKIKKFPKYEIYTEGSFDEFAKKYKIKRANLIKMNNEIFKDYEKSNDNNKIKFKKELKGKKLIVGYSKDSSEPNYLSEDVDKLDKNKGTYTPPNSEASTIKVFISEIQKTETNIINKIESLISDKDAAQKIEEQKVQIGSLNDTIIQNQKEIETFTKEFADLKLKLVQSEKDYQSSLTENSRYTDKLIFVDFIEPYARVASDYFLLAKTGQQRAIEFFEKLNITDSKNTLLIAQLILKFQANIPVKTGNWEEIIYQIKENKSTSNSDIIRSIKNIPTNEEKLKEFKRILFKEVFEKYASSLLILTEELRNLSKFTDGTNSIIKEYEEYFSKFSHELQNKVKVIGLDLNYVPLFENYIKYAAYTKLAGQSCSSPYKNIHNLEKDTVLEVISYGFGNEETKVILA